MGLDPGVCNLFTGITNIDGVKPFIISGSELSKINRKYDNLISNLQKKLKKARNLDSSLRIKRLWYRRNSKIDFVIKLVAKRIIDYAISHQIDKIIIGYNKGWKNKVNMGKRNNRTFYQIPYSRLVKALFNKGEENKITIVENNEAYTSKMDALSLETFEDCKIRCKSNNYVKKRICRGLYKSSTGRLVNADVNGALNIIRKHVNKEHPYLVDNINSYINSNHSTILTPIKFKISTLVKTKSAWDAQLSPSVQCSCLIPFKLKGPLTVPNLCKSI